jgi:hypothetical protein
MSTTVLVIAPHLFAKKHVSRHRLRRTYLNKSFMATDNNDTDPQLPDDTRSLQLMQDERAADQAALGEGRVATDSYSDRARRRASDKTDSSDSSSAGACHYTYRILQLWDADSCMLFTVSYFRPVQIIAENETLKLQLKDVQEQRVTDLKDAEARVDRRVREAVREAEERADHRVREAEERADRRIREAEERRVFDLKDAERRVQEAEERRVADLERSERLLNAILGNLIFDISCRCS